MRISDWSSDVCSSDLPATGWRRVDVEVLNRGLSEEQQAQRMAHHGRASGAGTGPEGHRARRYEPTLHPGIGRIRPRAGWRRSEEHTSELQSLMRISYAVFCLKKKTNTATQNATTHNNHHTFIYKSYTLSLLQSV